MTGTPDFYKLAPPDYPLVSLVACGNNKNDEVLIRFIAGTTEHFDLNYDASKLYSCSEDVPQLAINAGNQALAVNTLPGLHDNLCISLDYTCGKAGFYQISLSDRTNLDKSVKLFLKDQQNSSFINLSAALTYAFYHNPSYDKNRFQLYFNPSDEILNNNEDESYFSVYTERNNVHIIRNSTEDIEGQLYIVTILGQNIYEATLDNSQRFNIPVHEPTGYYILYIITNQNVYSKKMLIIN
jgi:hypothetical protein